MYCRYEVWTLRASVSTQSPLFRSCFQIRRVSWFYNGVYIFDFPFTHFPHEDFVFTLPYGFPMVNFVLLIMSRRRSSTYQWVFERGGKKKPPENNERTTKTRFCLTRVLSFFCYSEKTVLQPRHVHIQQREQNFLKIGHDFGTFNWSFDSFKVLKWKTLDLKTWTFLIRFNLLFHSKYSRKNLRNPEVTIFSSTLSHLD